ncbi:hypothetical protein BGX27_004604 [Mortierella sp. AM989]|nr:hypothetical protein BGX27_004604 [Mortierella sp. AM989]
MDSQSPDFNASSQIDDYFKDITISPSKNKGKQKTTNDPANSETTGMDSEPPRANFNASSQIDAHFQDIAMSPSKNKGKQKTTNDLANSEDEQNQDWEWVEETEYIILDFGGASVDAKDMETMSSAGYSLIGLDTPAPYFKAGINAFKGFWEENAVTEDLLFEMKAREDMEDDDSDEENNSDSLDLKAIVTKRIIFEPIELVPIPHHDDRAQKSKSKPAAEVEGEDGTSGRTRDIKVSIWKAAYDAIGIEQRYRRGTNPRSHIRKKGKKKTPTATTKETGESSQAGASTASSSAQTIDQGMDMHASNEEDDDYGEGEEDEEVGEEEDLE